MMRSSGAALALCSLSAVSLFVASDARAQGTSGPHMWGIGPKVGMMIIPGRYPYAFPGRIERYDFLENGPRAGDPNADEPTRDLDANGNPLFTTLSPVGFDLRLGGEGFYGIDAQNRLGAGVGLGVGGRYSDFWFTLNYDRVLYSNNPFDLVAGVQVGYGGVNFAGDDAAGGAEERLKMSYYPIRVRLAGQFRDKTRMYGLGLFVQDSVPARTTYTDRAGVVQDSVGGPGNFLLFFTAGLEVDVQFGDFTPPKKKKKGGAAGNKQGGGGAKGGGAKGGGAKGGGAKSGGAKGGGAKGAAPKGGAKGGGSGGKKR